MLRLAQSLGAKSLLPSNKYASVSGGQPRALHNAESDMVESSLAPISDPKGLKAGRSRDPLLLALPRRCHYPQEFPPAANSFNPAIVSHN